VTTHTNITDRQAELRTALLDRLRREIAEVLDELIPESSRCALVDFPAHGNVGDSVIWLGERAYLRDRRVTVTYACDIGNYFKADLARALDGGGTILIHGGGNFGDLWPHHHALRLRVIRDWPGHRIIQLPQTVYFQTTEAREETRQAIDAQGNFHLVARDRPSYEAYQRHFSAACSLGPDMALYLGNQAVEGVPSGDFFWLRRSDKESLGATTRELVSGITTQDWLQDGKRLLRLSESITNWKQRWFFVRRVERALYDPFARARLRRGYRMLRQGRVVITERLHGHILCLLAGMPNVLIDNSYGKNAGFYRTWTDGWSGTRFVGTPAEARAQAEDLLRSLGGNSATER
jgi:exopolysaccharide biosynthesis predicted pyruvyltransferase EpsI